MKTRFFSILLISLVPLLAGFDLDNAVVSKSEIRAGGPPKDGIPAILSPRFVSADRAGHLETDDMVIGVSIGREIKTLSASDIEELSNGSGWGFAKAAELNGVPGPVHMLEMKTEIGLGEKQVRELENLYEQMLRKHHNCPH